MVVPTWRGCPLPRNLNAGAHLPPVVVLLQALLNSLPILAEPGRQQAEAGGLLGPAPEATQGCICFSGSSTGSINPSAGGANHLLTHVGHVEVLGHLGHHLGHVEVLLTGMLTCQIQEFCLEGA